VDADVAGVSAVLAPSDVQSFVAGPDRARGDHQAADAALACAAGEVPLLRIEAFPDAEAKGAVTPALALLSRYPDAGSVAITPMGKQTTASVWISGPSGTYVGTVQRDGTWFVSRAQFLGCRRPGNPAAPSGVKGPVG
jgi:hypothetical protein